MRGFIVSSILFFALLFASSPVRAESQFWEEMATPGITEYRSLVAEARELFDRGDRRSALERLERAQRLLPDQPAAHAWAGSLLTRSDRFEDATRAWDRVLALDPSFLEGEESLAFDCTIAFARVGRYRQAAELYSGMLARGVSDQLRPVVLVNMAEMLIAASCEGLDEAIDLYQEAVRDSPDRAGAQWGLGAALARAGRDEEAEVALAAAVRLDPQWTTFSRSGSFFVPPYDIHFYRALGWEQIGNHAQARLEWQTYLEAGGAEGCWNEIARAHLQALEGRSRRRSR